MTDVAAGYPELPETACDTWIRRVVGAIDSFTKMTGWAIAWLILPMVGCLVVEVIGRYFFNKPTVWAYDMTFMLYGSFFMLGSAFTLMKKSHIRTDLFYDQWSVRTQGKVDIVCYLLLYFPALILFLTVSWDYFLTSFLRNERIVTSPWMPIVWPFKLTMPLATALLLIQGVSELLKSGYAARRGKWL
ncbi:TRAP transporter small permease subunit [Parapusillimonas sp. JC17]|uniref:TRAP transporter small permease subunit n=1 Tax=Parapusillimonas sp. JC17 TaxID=3445768 RepID=UPI003FA12EF7